MDAKLTQYLQSWTVAVELSAADEIPDITKPHTTIIFRPDLVVVSFHASGDEKPELSGASIYGPRVLKNGLGARQAERLWPFQIREMAPWVRNAVELAKGLVDG